MKILRMVDGHVSNGESPEEQLEALNIRQGSWEAALFAGLAHIRVEGNRLDAYLSRPSDAPESLGVAVRAVTEDRTNIIWSTTVTGTEVDAPDVATKWSKYICEQIRKRLTFALLGVNTLQVLAESILQAAKNEQEHYARLLCCVRGLTP